MHEKKPHKSHSVLQLLHLQISLWQNAGQKNCEVTN